MSRAFAQHKAGVGGDVSEQPLLGGREGLAGTERNGQRPEQLPSVPNRIHAIGAREGGRSLADEGHGSGPVICRPRRGPTHLRTDGQPDGRSLRPGRLGDEPRQPRDRVLDGVRPTDPFTQLGQDLFRRGALAVHEPVREPVRPIPGRLEGDGDDRGPEDRQGEVRIVSATQGCTDAGHDPDEHGGDEQGERAEDQGPVDDHVDVVEAVLQDRHARRDRDGPAARQGQERSGQIERPLGDTRDGDHEVREEEEGREAPREEQPLHLLVFVAARPAEAPRHGDDRQHDDREERQTDDRQRGLHPCLGNPVRIDEALRLRLELSGLEGDGEPKGEQHQRPRRRHPPPTLRRQTPLREQE